jgi:4a-hydroxytetrahydrobiopterin dehydratase
VTRVAFLSEAAAHHPDVDVRYKRVRLVLSTHEAKGVTRRDLDLAAEIDRLAP